MSQGQGVMKSLKVVEQELVYCKTDVLQASSCKTWT